MAGYIGKAQSLANLSEADTLDSVTGRGATTTNNLNVGTVTADSLTVDTTTLVVDDTNDRVGVNDSSPEAKLDVYIGTGLTTFGDFSDSLRVQGGNNTGKYVPITFGGYGSYAPASIGYLVTTGTGNTKGDLVFGTRDVTTDTRPTERMRIDSAGRVTMPYQPAFYAYLTSNPVASGTNVLVPFNATSFNVGNHFDTSSGDHKFVAPVDGVSSFQSTVNTYSVSVGSSLKVTVKVNGSEESQGGLMLSDHTGDQNVTVSITRYLSANDYVQIYHQSDDTSRYFSGGSWTWFSGYLVG